MYATLDKLRLPAEAGPQQPGFDDAPAVPLVEAAPCPRSRALSIFAPPET